MAEVKSLTHRYGLNIPISEIERIKEKQKPTITTPVPTKPTVEQQIVAQRASIRRGTPVAPTPTPTTAPITGKEASIMRTEIQVLEREIRDAPTDTFLYEGKTITKDEALRLIKQSYGDIGQYQLAYRRYQGQREQLLKVHINPDTMEPIWEAIPKDEWKYYPGAESKFEAMAKSNEWMEFIGGMDAVKKGMGRYEGIGELNFKERVREYYHGKYRDEGELALAKSVAQVLWEDATVVDVEDKFYGKQHPVWQHIYSFMHGFGQSLVGVATFPVALAQLVGVEIPEITKAKEYAEEFISKSTGMGPGGLIGVHIGGEAMLLHAALTKSPEEVQRIREQLDREHKKQQQYPTQTLLATGGELAGLWLGHKGHVYLKHTTASLLGKSIKYSFKVAPKLYAKSPFKPKILSKLADTPTIKTAKKYYSEGARFGYDLPLIKRKVFDIDLKKGDTFYKYYKSPEGLKIKFPKIAKATFEVHKKIEKFRGFGKRTLMTAKEVKKYYEMKKWGEYSIKGERFGPYFDTTQIMEFGKLTKPKGSLWWKRIQRTYGSVEAKSRATIGKYIPEKYQLLAPKQYVPDITLTRVGLKGFKRPLLAKQIPALESAMPKPGTLAYKGLFKTGYQYMTRPSKLTYGPLELQRVALGPKSSFITFDKAVPGFTMKDAFPVTKLISMKKQFIRPELFAKRIYAKEWQPTLYQKFRYNLKPLSTDIKAQAPITLKVHKPTSPTPSYQMDIQQPKPQLTYKPPLPTLYELAQRKATLPSYKKPRIVKPTTIKIPSSEFDTLTGLAFKTTTKLSTGSILLLKPISETERIKIPIVDTAKALITPQEIKTLSIQSQQQVQKVVLQQETKQKLIYDYHKKIPAITPSFKYPSIYKTKIKPKLIIPISGGAPEEKVPYQKAITDTGYHGYVKKDATKKAKWVKVTKKSLPKYHAKGIAAKATDNTISRSFKVMPTNKSAEDTNPKYQFYWHSHKHKFRKPIRKGKEHTESPIWIEKTAHAIDTPGEKKELSVARWLAEEQKVQSTLMFKLPYEQQKRGSKAKSKKISDKYKGSEKIDYKPYKPPTFRM